MTDESLRHLFQDTHTIVALGVNNRPGEPNYETVSYEQSQGYKIIPVNPDTTTVLGQPSVSAVAQVHEPVDMIHVLPHYPAMTDLQQVTEQTGCKTIWFEPGVPTGSLSRDAERLGMTVVTGRPFRREHQRLMSDVQM